MGPAGVPQLGALRSKTSPGWAQDKESALTHEIVEWQATQSKLL